MNLVYCEAVWIDVLMLVQLFVDDLLGVKREDALELFNFVYVIVFDVIFVDFNNELVVIESDG